MREEWEYKGFEYCLVKAAKAKQVQTSEYYSGSKYPIISQEDKMVSGYCDDSSLLYHIDSPVVIFGDHTRVLKYVDFDFVVGADGVKILIPKDFLKAKFLLYYLRWYKVPSLGYSRHFKLLKEIVLPIPPLAEQKRIVEELDLLSSIIDKKKAQLKELDQLAQSIFYSMFGDPINNEKGWEVKTLKDSVQEMFLGPFGSALKVSCYVPESDAYAMVYEQKHAILGSLEMDNHFINKEKFESLSRFEVKPKDFIMSCRGTIGRIFQLPDNAPKGIIHPSLMKIRIKEDVYGYSFFIVLLQKIVAEQTTKGNCVQMAITAKELGNMPFILPPLSLQQEFAERVEAIERQKALVRQSIDETQTLFDCRMDYWFN